MSEDELKGYEVLLRVAIALEGINSELAIMNSEGIVVFSGKTMEEN